MIIRSHNREREVHSRAQKSRASSMSGHRKRKQAFGHVLRPQQATVVDDLRDSNGHDFALGRPSTRAIIEHPVLCAENNTACLGRYTLGCGKTCTVISGAIIFC